MCGEKILASMQASKKKGSPPRVRGKGPGKKDRKRLPRITPACAGKRCPADVVVLPTQDHPRVCGEKPPYLQKGPGQPGSPPRVRGKVLNENSRIHSRGITPACAGKRRKRRTHSPASWDHPRVCGEKSSRLPRRLKNAGSPPRVRGKDGPRVYYIPNSGITPAYAGKRRRVPAKLAASRDHPRVCGEKISFFLTGCSPRGSPSRMRGKAPHR